MAGPKHKAVVAGHVCLDVIPQFVGGGGLPVPGALAEVGPVTVAAGGSVSNTGLALHRLGVDVRLVGRVGDDAFGREVRRLYEAAGPGLGDDLQVAAGEATSYTVVLNPPAEDRRFLHCPGVNATFSAADVPAEALRDARLFHFGYPPIMRDLCADNGGPLREIFAAAKSAGLVTSLDLCGIDPSSWAGRVNWPALLAKVLPDVDLFLPSLDETLAALSRSAETPAELGGVADRLLAMGPAVVGLKMGADGVYLKTATQRGRVTAAGLDADVWAGRELLGPTFDVSVAGTTGAGDTTIAGFLAAVLRGLPPERALDVACAAGAACVSRPDATSGLCDFGGIEAFLSNPPPRRRPAAFAGWQILDGGILENPL